jgi:hypothetical protein
MFGKIGKALEWIGHGSTAWQVAGWLGFPTAGFLGWLMTFFIAAAEGLSVTAVWLLSLCGAALAAAAYAGAMIGWTNYRSIQAAQPKTVSRQDEAPPSPKKPEKPSLLSLFMSAFEKHNSGGLSLVYHGYAEVPFSDATKMNVFFQIVEDHNNFSKFIALYIPETKKTYAVCEHFSTNYKQFLDMPIYATSESSSSASQTSSKDAVFTGRVFVYYETHMTISELGRLEDMFVKAAARPEFRGPQYAMTMYESFRAGNAEAPPRYEIKDGLPAKIEQAA